MVTWTGASIPTVGCSSMDTSPSVVRERERVERED